MSYKKKQRKWHPLFISSCSPPFYSLLSHSPINSFSIRNTKSSHAIQSFSEFTANIFKKINMKESIKCCISCILPCGALDVIRIVHVSGRVEEISRDSLTARDIMNIYPRHVLRKPVKSSPYDEEVNSGTKSLILSPQAELQRGKIYFLMPVKEKEKPEKQAQRKKSRSKRAAVDESSSNRGENIRNNNDEEDRMRLLVSDRYLSEIMKESKALSGHDHKDRRRGRVGVWRPHLPKIDEFIDDVI